MDSEVANSLGLTGKIKFMIIGSAVSVDDWQPLAGLIKWVDHFPYLGSVIADESNIDVEIDKRIANASKAFGALRQSIFVIIICPSKPSGRLVYYQLFYMAMNVGHRMSLRNSKEPFLLGIKFC